MESFCKLFSKGKKTSWGVETLLEFDRQMCISDQFSSIRSAARREIQSLFELAETYRNLNYKQRIGSELLKSYEHLGSGLEGSVYRIPLKSDINVALKLYDEDFKNGIYYFKNLITAHKKNEFDTLTPYFATPEYILTDLIPDYPEFDVFVEQHPHLKEEVTKALLGLQIDSGFTDIGLSKGEQGWHDEDDEESVEFLEDEFGRVIDYDDADDEHVKHVHISHFDPSKKYLRDRYRFFIYDMMAIDEAE